jgi:Ni/Fe-hydrogenase subunit HybB-like protein
VIATMRAKLNLSRSSYVLLALGLVGVVLAIVRFAVGLGPTTNLSDHYPWGLWIGLDVFLIPAAGAAFTVSAISHFFGREDYHKILRPAVLAGLLGYVSVAIILIMDLGRWHQFYSILIPENINLHSFLEEVALSVTLYTVILLLEIAPTLLEKTELDVPLNLIRRMTILIAAVGILISTVHQSSLGSMFIILRQRLHPLWWTPILPALFFIQALFGGLATAAVVVHLVRRHVKAPPDEGLSVRMGRLIRVLLVLYTILKVGDIAIAGELPLAFSEGQYSLLLWAELILGLAVPLAILFSRRGRSRSGVFWSSVWVIFGLFFNRLTVAWIGLEAPAWATYVPHWMEVLSSIGIIAGAVFVYIVVARLFELFPQEHQAHA